MKFYADIVYTNLPIAGAFRGYGAPQGFFAMEVQMDEAAEAVGMDPVEFRQKNHIRVGDTDLMSAAAGEGSAGVHRTRRRSNRVVRKARVSGHRDAATRRRHVHSDAGERGSR
jgi:CO/xanthine dehydrogenase Mo-binding subunit